MCIITPRHPIISGPLQTPEIPYRAECHFLETIGWTSLISKAWPLSVLVSQHTKVLCRVIVCNWEMRDQFPQQIIAVSHGRLKWSQQGQFVNGKPAFKQSIDNTSRFYLYSCLTRLRLKNYTFVKWKWIERIWLFVFHVARSWQPPRLLLICNTPNE